MLTPLSRMRPWKLASETATLDNLSGGRVTLAVGSARSTRVRRVRRGHRPPDACDYWTRGSNIPRPYRTGRRSQRGQALAVPGTSFMPAAPTRSDGRRMPICVVGALGPPEVDGPSAPVPKQLAPARRQAHAEDHRRDARVHPRRTRFGRGAYDVVVEDATPSNDAIAAAALVPPYAEARTTSWLETAHGLRRRSPRRSSTAFCIPGPPPSVTSAGLD